MKLVTIVIEELARSTVERALQKIGVHGYTVFPVEGSGAKGQRIGDTPESGNLQFQIIAPEDRATELMEHARKELFPHFAVIVYETDVRVLRPEKF